MDQSRDPEVRGTGLGLSIVRTTCGAQTARPSGWKAVRAGAAALRSALSRSRTAIEARFWRIRLQEKRAMPHFSDQLQRRHGVQLQRRKLALFQAIIGRRTDHGGVVGAQPQLRPCIGENPVWPRVPSSARAGGRLALTPPARHSVSSPLSSRASMARSHRVSTTARSKLAARSARGNAALDCGRR